MLHDDTQNVLCCLAQFVARIIAAHASHADEYSTTTLERYAAHAQHYFADKLRAETGAAMLVMQSCESQEQDMQALEDICMSNVIASK